MTFFLFFFVLGITLDELQAALKLSARGKKPGSDGLPYEFYSQFCMGTAWACNLPAVPSIRTIKSIVTRPQAVAQLLPACDGKSERSSCFLFLVLRTPRSRGRCLM